MIKLLFAPHGEHIDDLISSLNDFAELSGHMARIPLAKF